MFTALDEDGRIDVTFASDIRGRDGIAVMDPRELRRHVRTRSHRSGALEWQSGVIRLLLRRRYDDVVLLGDVSTLSTWVASLIARSRRMRVHFWTIGWHRPETGLKRRIRLAFYRLAHQLLLYGSTARDIGLDMGFPARRMRVIGNSVEQMTAPEELRTLRIPSKEPGELWVGAVIRLSAVKRLDLLVSAAAELVAQGSRVRVVLVGAGPMRDELTRQARSQSVRMDVIDPVYGAEALGAVYERLDITVVPAAAGLTAIQSMSFGVPVVSDDAPYAQMPEWEAIVPGRTGELYAAGDPHSLAQAIDRLASRLADDREPVASACRHEAATRWSVRSHADRITEALLDRQG